MPVNTTIKIRKGTESEWQSSNPVLSSGEPGYVTDSNRFKIGDGSSNWNSLSYASVVPSGFLAGSGISLSLGNNGSSLTISSTGVITVSNYGDNRLLTSDGTSTGINAENNLSFDGSLLSVSGNFIARTGIVDLLSFNTNNGAVSVQGEIGWNSTEGTVDIALEDNVAVQINEHRILRVRNTTSGTLYKGQVVYASGVHANGIITPNLYVADGSIQEIRFIGMMLADVSVNNNGYAIDFGHVNNIDTRGNVVTNYSVGDETWADGDILYVHPTVAGKLTKVEPKHAISVAYVLDAASNGKIFARPTNFGDLNQLHDVNISGATNGQFLQYNSVTDYWVPSSSGNFSSLTINNNQIVVGTGVANHVAYWNSTSGIVADSGQLYWDSTNNRLGIGTSSPSDFINISGSTGSAAGIKFDNLDGYGGSIQGDNASLYFYSNNSTLVYSIKNNKIRMNDGGATSTAIELTSNGSISQDGNGGGLTFSGTTAKLSNGLHVTAGNVGIGTVTPSSILDISQNDAILKIGDASSNAGTGPRIQITSKYGATDTSAYLGYSYYNNKTYLQHGRAGVGGVELRTANGTPRLYIEDTTGYVGIGTSSPTSILTVSGIIQLTDTAGNRVQFFRGGGTQYDYSIAKEGNHLAISTANDGSTFRYTQFGYHSGSTWTPKTVINNYNGSVGIGTTSPSAQFHTIGTGIFTSGLGIGTTSPATILHAYNPVSSSSLSEVARFGSSGVYDGNFRIMVGSTSDRGGELRYYEGSTEYSRVNFDVNRIDFITRGAYPINFLTNNNGNEGHNLRMTITSAGNVGINTASPTSHLHVNGSGYFASGLKASGVFNIDNISLDGNEITSNTNMVLRAQTSTAEIGLFSQRVYFGGQSIGAVIMSENLIGGEVGLITENDDSIAVWRPNENAFCYGGGVTGNEPIIVSDNKVGIGYTTSSLPFVYNFQVAGTGNFTQNLLVNGTGVSISGHTHIVSDITDFSTGVADEVSTTLSAGTGILLDYNSGTDTLTVSISGLINNPTDNRILTSRDNTTTGIDAEPNLTFDGTNLTSPYLVSSNASGDEGGEIQLAKPPNGTLSGGVTIDAYQNKLRFFEQGGSARGFYLDLTEGVGGASTPLKTKSLSLFTALDNQPPASAFATLDTRNSIAVLDFDDTTEESCVFIGVIPDNANLSSGLSVRINWMATSATTGSCRWGVRFEKMTTDLDSDSFDTATEAHSTTNGTAGIPTITTLTCTSIDSIVAGDFFRIKIYRDVSDTTNDTMTGDAELISVEVRSVL
jgi:hypothetical protein